MMIYNIVSGSGAVARIRSDGPVVIVGSAGAVVRVIGWQRTVVIS
jgi:hypothetical protein